MPRRRYLVFFLFLFATHPRVGASQTPADTVRSLDSAWARSYATHDTMLAKAIFADDLVITGPNGNLKDKRAELGDVAAQPELQLEYFRTSDVTVRMLDGAAVVIGLAEWRFVFRGGPPTTTRMRYTAVYARRGARWQMVVLHLGRVRD
jgi:ketosteroid isomerase-like protein